MIIDMPQAAVTNLIPILGDRLRVLDDFDDSDTQVRVEIITARSRPVDAPRQSLLRYLYLSLLG